MTDSKEKTKAASTTDPSTTEPSTTEPVETTAPPSTTEEPNSTIEEIEIPSTAEPQPGDTKTGEETTTTEPTPQQIAAQQDAMVMAAIKQVLSNVLDHEKSVREVFLQTAGNQGFSRAVLDNGRQVMVAEVVAYRARKMIPLLSGPLDTMVTEIENQIVMMERQLLEYQPWEGSDEDLLALVQRQSTARAFQDWRQVLKAMMRAVENPPPATALGRS